MGVRMMVIYGLPFGLLAAGSLIDDRLCRDGTLAAVGSRPDAGDRAALARRSVPVHAPANAR